MKITIDKILVWIIALILPFILLMGSIQLIMTPQFPALEYQREGFPEDSYGFTTRERTEWARYAVSYLTNDESINYLQDLKFPDGSPLYRVSELDHMEDVKAVVQTALTVWYAFLGLTIGVAIWFVSFGNWKKFSQALRNGAWLTVGLIGVVVIMLTVNFNRLFEQFHALFFTEGTWVFYANDTLIRLFPLVFWRDAFLLVFLITLIVAVLILRLTRKKKNKPETVGG